MLTTVLCVLIVFAMFGEELLTSRACRFSYEPLNGKDHMFSIGSSVITRKIE